MIRGPFGTEPGWPQDLLSSRTQGFRRLQVEDGHTAQEEGRLFRLSREFNFSDTPLVLRVTSPIDFKLHYQQLTADTGGVVMRAYRTGAEGGTWTAEPVYGTNGASFVPDYTPVIAVESGGTFTPSGPATETIRVRVSGATAQQVTVTGATGDTRLLPAGVYYLVFSRMTGVTGSCQGVYNLRYEEFPIEAQ